MGSPNFAQVNPMAHPDLNGWLSRRLDGKAMRALKIERDALLLSLKATGLAQPATILNFNPVALGLDGGIGFKVPSILDEAVNEEDRFVYKMGGVTYKASVLTIREPQTFTQIKDVKKEEDVEVGVYDVRACKQIEIAHCFLAAYTNATPSSSGMGGVVVFQGDRRVLERATGTKRLEIKVPTFIRLPNRTREYLTEAADFDEIAAKALKTQKAYCNRQTQQAQNYWDQGDEERKNITGVHRIWHQYELDMGWRQTAAPWVTLVNETVETCPQCGNPKKRADAWACWSCQRVYDPLAAYLAKEIPVSHQAMERIKEDDWPKVRKEEARRLAIRTGV